MGVETIVALGASAALGIGNAAGQANANSEAERLVEEKDKEQKKLIEQARQEQEESQRKAVVNALRDQQDEERKKKAVGIGGIGSFIFSSPMGPSPLLGGGS
jgi:hypothetical protein